MICNQTAPNDANSMKPNQTAPNRVNSMNPDQTAPLGQICLCEQTDLGP